MRLKSSSSTLKFHLLHDLFLIGLSSSLTLFLSFAFFHSLLLHHSTASEQKPIHASAVKETEKTAINDLINGDFKNPVKIHFEKNKKNFTTLGETNVSLLKFQLTAKQDSFLEQATIKVASFSKPYDLVNLQLYQNNKLVGSSGIFDRQAVFQNLHFDLKKEKATSFELKAKISDQADIGDRIQIGFENSGDLIIKDADSNILDVGLNTPLWSDALSVVGNKI